jgi:hypothetical protein
MSAVGRPLPHRRVDKGDASGRGWKSLLMCHTVAPPGRTFSDRSRLCGPGGSLAYRRPGVFVLVVLLIVPAVVWGQTMRWPEAVAALAAERTRAETCVRLLKRHAGTDAAALSRGELAYAAAEAFMMIESEMHGI